MTERVQLYCGNALDVLKGMPSGSVNCCVTSPPYWKLRDYQTGVWDGGDPECDHVANPKKTKRTGNPEFNQNRPYRDETKTPGYFADTCPKCGATKTDYQIGQEPTVAEYVANMVQVFREVKRVLTKDGTCWIVIGDSYAGSGKGDWTGWETEEVRQSSKYKKQMSNAGSLTVKKTPDNLPAKNLYGVPWRVAFALQDDGWILRSDIIWRKPNPMPSSVTDRPTTSHEYVFLLAKSNRYYYDADAIAEPLAFASIGRLAQDVAAQDGSTRANGGSKTNGNMKAVAKKNQQAGQCWQPAIHRI